MLFLRGRLAQKRYQLFRGSGRLEINRDLGQLGIEVAGLGGKRGGKFCCEAVARRVVWRAEADKDKAVGAEQVEAVLMGEGRPVDPIESREHLGLQG